MPELIPARTLLVRSMKWEAVGVLSLTLCDPDNRAMPPWRAGAHIDLNVEGGVRSAQYSLCGPRGVDSWKIAVLNRPAGQGVSRYVHQRLRPGNHVRVSDPRNHFTLKPAADYLFVAGGIGITPLLPMIEEAKANGRTWNLAYGGRSRAAMPFIPALSRHGSAVQLFAKDDVGRMPIRRLLDAASAGTAVYCCGPEEMLDAVRAGCTATGLGDPNFERFSPVPQKVTDAPAHAFSLILARSAVTLEVGPDKSIADVLDANGVFVPTSCRAGVCGSCETRVLSGQVDHRDALLNDAERLRSETMMVCVSRACGSSLTLDL